MILPGQSIADANDLIPVRRGRYLILDVGCAGGRSSRDETIVNVIGTEATEERAKQRALATTRRPQDFGPWREHGDGWYTTAGDGELRIIDLSPAS